MKGCVVLQRRFAPIGHAIAIELKEKHEVEEFCGYVITRRALGIIKSQKEISYTDLLLYEDTHNQYKKENLDTSYLKKLEAEYGLPNLWPYLALDRTIMMNIPPEEYSISPTPPYSHKQMLLVLQSHFRNTVNFLNKEKPDFIIGINVACAGTMILYHLAKEMGIKYYTIENGKIGNRITWSDSPLTLSGVDKIFEAIRKNGYKSPSIGEAGEFLEKFRDNPAPPSFAIEAKEKTFLEKAPLVPMKILRALTFTLRSIIIYLKTPYKSDITTENPFYLLWNKIKRKIRGMRNLKSIYNIIDSEEDFAYFPLHFEPEITTLLYSPFYTNQINLLTQIARSLPVHFKLYVKEHPAMLEYRPTEYYRELKKIPNLKLIDPKTSSFDLIQKCKLLATISGTAGFEACMLKKPVITFGDIFYNNLSFVKRCRSVEDAPFIIKQQLENFQYNEQEMNDFLSAIFEDTIPCDLVNAWGSGTEEAVKKMTGDQNFKKFVGSLAKKIGLE